jgi:hypothetical protein
MRSRIATFVGLPALTALLLRATPCYADMVGGSPDLRSWETPLILLGSLVLVAAVSGFSFVLLRRIARQRTAAADASDTAPVAHTEANGDE